MTPGTKLVTLLLTIMIFTMSSSTSQSFTRSVTGVKLSGGYMEVIKEQICSDAILRLTCRSLKAFLFILEAEYLADRTDYCDYDLKRTEEFAKKPLRLKNRYHTMITRHLRGNYVEDDNEEPVLTDLRTSLNKRCSGHQHCRYTIAMDHLGASSWTPANLRLKYACIPETAVIRYCNMEVRVTGGEGGFLRSPGYPLYYPGGNSCGWIFEALPGQRIVLTFHDLNIRSPELDGSCVDVVRVREYGSAIFESCSTAAGIKVVSTSNLVTLDLIASARLYPARGFFLQYQVLGCPDVPPPNGSYVSNSTVDTRTFLCRAGSVFPDIKERTRIIKCKEGWWSENVETLPSCVASSALILKAERDNHQVSNLSDDILGAGVRIGRGQGAVADNTDLIMDSTQPAMIKQADYVVDIVLPTVLIALLFVGNAIIVYIIFQYRKRKVPASQGEAVALNASTGIPPV